MKQKIENIQFWRLFACTIVFLVHFGQRLYFDGMLRSVTNFGAYGVQLFFIISGYLIANSYFAYGKKSLKMFYIKKAIGILPLYYIVIAYYYIVHTFVLKDVPADPTGFGWIRYLFVLNNILPDTGMYFWDNLGITWTIPYFVFAYAVLPLFLNFIKNFNSCLVFFISVAGISYFVDIFNGWFTILDYFPFFVFGILIYFAIKEEKNMEIIFLSCAGIIFFLTTGLSTHYMHYIYGALFVVLIVSTKDYKFKSNKIKKVLEITDNYSYTFYLAHGIVFIHCIDRVVWNRMQEAIVAVLGSILLTVLINRFLETPIKKLLTSKLNNI